MNRSFNWIILLSAFSLVTVRAQGILQPGNQWIFEYQRWFSPQFAFVDTTIETITIGPDTVINNLTYSKVTFSGIPVCLKVEKNEYLRGEGSKIFRLSPDHSQDFLMIDFEETVGYDLLFYGYDDLDTGRVVIDSFGIEIAYDGTPIEVQYMTIMNNQSFDDYTTYTVYKDMGFLFTGYLFPYLGSGLCDAESVSSLRCVVIGSDTVHFTQYDCFELPLINATQNISNQELKLYPNPASDYIQVPEGYFYKDAFNINGQRQDLFQEGSRIEVSSLMAGFHVIRFISFDQNQIFFSRLIINH